MFHIKQEEERGFYYVLASVKVPDRYATNIKRRIVDGNIYGLKSHDHDIIMQQLLLLVVRKMQNKNLGTVLIDFNIFFKELCSKVVAHEDFERLQNRIVVMLFHLEDIFLALFFDIMVHLIVYLPYEVKVTSPIIYHWIYSTERYVADPSLPPCKL